MEVRGEESDSRSTLNSWARTCLHAVWSHSRAEPALQPRKPSAPHLENLLIQDPGSEHGDAVGVDGGPLAPEEGFDDLLLAVDDDGDGLLLHADGHAVPPGAKEGKEGNLCFSPLTFSGAPSRICQIWPPVEMGYRVSGIFHGPAVTSQRVNFWTWPFSQ